jgi:tRNA threonylcarbamoyladenosine biosynthesis protein TsaE
VVVIQTRSVSETVSLGKVIGGLLRPGDVVALAGDLGTGKTHFIKGLARGVGIRKTAYISSPSFTLIHEYPGKIPFYHLDLYRLGTVDDAETLGLEEYFYGPGVTAIEWADKIPSLLPQELLWIRLRHTGEKSRSIEIQGQGNRYHEVMEKLTARVQGRDFLEEEV